MISIVVAMDQNHLIGKDNELPWHLPADLAFFKKVTMGKPIVMGRKTHESIGRILPGRENIILTRNKEFTKEGCTIVHSIDELQSLFNNNDEEICVIGGAEIIKEVFPIVDRLYITRIEYEFEGDTYFPPFDQTDWELINSEKGPKDDKNPYDYFFTIYQKK